MTESPISSFESLCKSSDIQREPGTRLTAPAPMTYVLVQGLVGLALKPKGPLDLVLSTLSQRFGADLSHVPA
jgi:hypothetical protein